VIFTLAMLPVATGATVWFMPLLMGPLMMVLIASPSIQQSIQQWNLAQLAALEVGVLLLSLLIVTIGMALGTTAMIARYASRLVLRTAKARLVGREQELELHRVVENLCIGAGLPKPRLYVIEAGAPNAFATGRDPKDASIAVTRGLLTLLDRRELEAAIAHELSHIGNQDTRLNTTLAGLVGALTIPLTLVTASLRRHRMLSAGALLMFAPMVFGILVTAVSFVCGEAFDGVHPVLRWWTLHALVAPFYLVFLAPLVARLIRRAVSREREFLADADAVLLTRSPEPLARALLKVGAAMDAPIGVGAATTHLYFVDPLRPEAPWLARRFRAHPPIEQRLELLAGMGSGVPPTALAEARRAGMEHRDAEAAPPDRCDSAPPESGEAARETASPETEGSGSIGPGAPNEREPAGVGLVFAEDAGTGAQLRLGESITPLLEEPDGWSRSLVRLPRDEVVTVCGKKNGYLRVTTRDDMVGYIGRVTLVEVVGDGRHDE
jgi:heat shock protein HtpX